MSAAVEVERVRLLEGEELAAGVWVQNDGPEPVEVELAPVRSRHLAIIPAGIVAVRVGERSEAEIEFSLRPRRWGAHAVGPLTVRTRDAPGRCDMGGESRRTRGSARLSTRGAAAAVGRPTPHAAVPRLACRPRPWRRDRVRRHPPVSGGRSGAARQLAGDRQTRFAPGEPAPPRALE